VKSFIAALRSLVLPFGATSGPRIVLDGVNGRIQIFNAANTLIEQLDAAGFVVMGAQETLKIDSAGNLFIRENPDNGAYLQLTSALNFGGLIFLQPENSTVPALVFFPASMYVDAIESGGVNSQPELNIVSPYVTGAPNKGLSSISLLGQTNTSATDDSAILFRASQLKSAIGYQMSLGIVDQNFSTVNTAGIAAAEVHIGDQLERLGPMLSDHFYAIEFTFQFFGATAAARLGVKLYANSTPTPGGTLIRDFGQLTLGTAGIGQPITLKQGFVGQPGQFIVISGRLAGGVGPLTVAMYSMFLDDRGHV
jgi:hypothetical protein